MLDVLEGEQQSILMWVGVAAVGYVAFTMGFLDPVLQFATGNLRLALGLGVIGLLGWWALDEADAEDDREDVIEKTSSRAENATRGLFSSVELAAGGAVAIVAAFGDSLLDLLVGFVGAAGNMPLLASNLGVLGALWAVGVGLATANEALTIGVVLVVMALISRRGGD